MQTLLNATDAAISSPAGDWVEIPGKVAACGSSASLWPRTKFAYDRGQESMKCVR